MKKKSFFISSELEIFVYFDLLNPIFFIPMNEHLKNWDGRIRTYG